MFKRLQTAQNNVIRFILSKDARAHIHGEDFCSLNILNIHNRAKQLRLFNHVFNIFNKIGPENLRSNFTRVSDIHHYRTRHSVQQNSQVQKLPLSTLQALFIKMVFVIGPAYQAQSSQ